jgi:hypothetical protein
MTGLAMSPSATPRGRAGASGSAVYGQLTTGSDVSPYWARDCERRHKALVLKGRRSGECTAPLGLRRALGRSAPRVVGRCRARGRAAAGVSGVWRNRLAYRSGIRLRPLGWPATASFVVAPAVGPLPASWAARTCVASPPANIIAQAYFVIVMVYSRKEAAQPQRELGVQHPGSQVMEFAAFRHSWRNRLQGGNSRRTLG